jgi:hypothetical protein
MRLLAKQKVFSRLVARLIEDAYRLGYEVTLAEAYRPPEVAAMYAERAKRDGRRAIADSLHTERLAIDLNLFRDGRFLRKTEEYEPLGLVWESYSEPEYDCSWGGRFDDGNHFSIVHRGRR